VVVGNDNRTAGCVVEGDAETAAVGSAPVVHQLALVTLDTDIDTALRTGFTMRHTGNSTNSAKTPSAVRYAVSRFILSTLLSARHSHATAARHAAPRSDMQTLWVKVAVSP